MTDKASDPASKGPRPPAFLDEFPEDARLQPLVVAYLAGDYATVRAGAHRLADDASEPDVKRAASDLLRRISPDPMLKWMYLATLVLILAVGLYWMRKA